MEYREFRACIEACNACADACDQCASACLAEPMVKDMIDCIRTDIDCAALCRLAAAYMARDSKLSHIICGACKAACEACAEECGSHAMDHCQSCAQACRACAEACGKMVEALAA